MAIEFREDPGYPRQWEVHSVTGVVGHIRQDAGDQLFRYYHGATNEREALIEGRTLEEVQARTSVIYQPQRVRERLEAS